MPRDNSVGLADLHVQLRMMTKLFVVQLKEKISQKELVRILMTTGASDQEIAETLGTTPGTVAATKARLKKEKSSEKTPVAIEPEVS